MLEALYLLLMCLPIAAPIALVAVTAKTGVDLARGRDIPPVSLWRRAALGLACLFVVFYTFGLLDGGMFYTRGPNELCMLEGGGATYTGRSDHGLLPLHNTMCERDGVPFELVSAWLNPALALITVAFAGCVAAAVVSSVRARRAAVEQDLGRA